MVLSSQVMDSKENIPQTPRRYKINQGKDWKTHFLLGVGGILLCCEISLLKNYKIEKLQSLEKSKENKNNL